MTGAPAFLRANARWIGGAFLLFLLSSFGQTFFIALSAGAIRTEHGLTHGGFATLYMAATLVSALSLPLLGGVVDRHTPQRVALVVVPLLALAAAAMALTTHVAALFAVLVALRLLGQGMCTHLAFTALGRWFVARRGQALSLATLGMNVGEALLPLAFVAAGAALGWRGAWGVAAALVLLAAMPVVVALFARERHEPPAAAGAGTPATRSWTRAQVLRDPLFYVVMLAMVPPALIGNTVFFHQVHLAELRGWPATLFPAAFPLLAGFTVLCSLLAGAFVDRRSARALLPWYLLPMGLALLLLAHMSAPWSVFVFMALYGIANGCSLTLFGTLWPELYGVAHLGAIRSVIVATLVLMSAVGPGAAGLLIDRGVAFTSMLSALGLYCVAAALLMHAIARRLRARD
ncbi:MAG: MFS transporter [Piscinibacter sp.]|nr:MFS transporter [Piscinibacter sp.]